jgi:hypothetical protein
LKNLVLIMVFILIITVFIAFNYLLWDRENFQEINYSKTAAIDAFSKQLRNLEERNKLLETNIVEMEKDIEEINQKNELLAKQLEAKEKEIESINSKLNNKEQFIQILKNQIELSPIKDIVKDWVDKINNGDYEGAYALQYGKDEVNNSVTKDKFISDYKGAVESIEIKSIELVVEKPSVNKFEDCLVLKAIFDVKKIEEYKGQFFSGNNIRYFIFKYNTENMAWTIKEISYYY